MRDLLAEAWRRQRALQQPKARRNRKKFLLVTLACVLGLSIGAIPVALHWSGQHSTELSFERALALSNDQAKDAGRSSSLQLRLMALTAEGLEAMRGIARTRTEYRQPVASALTRLRSRLQAKSATRTSNPDTPKRRRFDEAITTLQQAAATTTTAELDQSLEALVDNIGQMIDITRAHAKAEGPTGQAARAALAWLRTNLDVR